MPPQLSDPHYAPLPPITPLSYGYGSPLSRIQNQQPRWKRALVLAPIGVVIVLITAPYIPFVGVLSLHATWGQRHRPFYSCFQLIIFHFLFGMTLWSYITAFRTPAGAPSKPIPIPELENEEETIGLQLIDENNNDLSSGAGSGSSIMAKGTNGGRRWCRKCEAPKPDRCHHCSMCKKCVLKMDHHCVWLGTCIGYFNYRSFLLFLTYTALYAWYIAFESFFVVKAFFTESDAMTEVGLAPVSHLMLLVMGITFGLSIGSFAAYHWYLTCHNTTTLESLDPRPPLAALPDSPTNTTTFRWRPDHVLTRQEFRSRYRAPNVWDLGWKRNIASLNPGYSLHHRRHLSWRFLLPGRVGGDGLEFEYNEALLERLRRKTRKVRLGQNDIDTDDEESSGSEDLGLDRMDYDLDAEGSQGEEEEESSGRLRKEPGRGKTWETRSRRSP